MIASLLTLFCVGAPKSQSPLDAYPQLAAKTTVECAAETVESLLKRLSAKTGVHILATTAVRDDVLVIYAKDRSTKDILAEIAHHFNWTWELNRDALVLRQTPKQEDDEVQAVAEQVAQSYAKWQKKAIDASKAPPATAADFSAYRDLQDARRKHNETPHDPDQATNEERQKWAAELRTIMTKGGEIGRRISPAWRMADEVVANLKTADFKELDRTGRLVFAYAPTLWQKPLPERAKGYAQELVNAAAKNSSLEWSVDSDRLQQAQDLGYGPARPFRADEVATVRVTISRNRIGDPSIPSASPVRVTIVSKSGDLLSDRSLSISDFASPVKDVPKARDKDEFDEPLTQTDELKELTTGTYRMLPPESESLAAFGKVGSQVLPVVGAARVLIAAAKAGNYSVISDLYDPRGYPAVVWHFGTMREALDGYAGRFGQSWAKSGSWVEVRTRNWQFIRSMTVTPTKLFALRDMVLSKDRPTLAIAMAIASQISDHQAASWYVNWLFIRDRKAADLLANEKKLYALRFAASVSPNESGIPSDVAEFRYASLTSAQRDLIDAWVYRMDDRDFDQNVEMTREDGPDSTDAKWIRANWTKFGHSDPRGDFEPSQQYPTGLPGDARIFLHSSSANAMLLGTERGMSMAYSEAAFVRSGYLDPATKDVYVQLAKEDRLFLSLDPSPLAMKGLQFGAISPAPDSRPVPLGQLPADVLDRLRKSYEALRNGG